MDIDRLSRVTKHIRYLLWKKDPDCHRWAEILATALGDRNRCQKIIAGSDQPTEQEIVMICERFGQEREIFSIHDSLDLNGESMLKLNVAFLLNSLPQGMRKQLAGQLHVRQETVSRWAKTKVPPARRHRSSILKFMGLPESLDLKVVPLFLSIEPIGVFQRKLELKQKLDSIPNDDLKSILPALERLMR